MALRSYQLKAGKHYRKEAGVMKCYRTGDYIKLTEQEAKSIMDKLVLHVVPAPLIDPDAPAAKDEPKVEEGKLAMKMVGRDKYNVVNTATNRTVNEKLLTKAEAEALVGAEDDNG